MQELSLQEIQEIELRLLVQFDNICKKKHLRYSLSSGTLLGAVRHGGFIPWDDDIDVNMPREDYDRFIEICMTGNVPFVCFSCETNEKYTSLITKLSDPSTIIKEEVGYNDLPVGVNIDVFPLDGLGNSEEEALRTYRITEWKRELLNATRWRKFTRSKTHSLVMEPIRLCLFLIGRFVNPKRLVRSIEEYNRRRNFDECNYVCALGSAYRKKEIMPREIMNECIDMNFEGQVLKGYKNFDAYLTRLYGDYMTPPSEEKRKTHHTFRAYRK